MNNNLMTDCPTTLYTKPCRNCDCPQCTGCGTIELIAPNDPNLVAVYGGFMRIYDLLNVDGDAVDWGEIRNTLGQIQSLIKVHNDEPNHRQSGDSSIEDIIASFAQQLRDGSISGEEAADALRGKHKEN